MEEGSSLVGVFFGVCVCGGGRGGVVEKEIKIKRRKTEEGRKSSAGLLETEEGGK